MKKFLLLIGLSSCTLYPTYERPSLENMGDWRAPLSSENGVDIEWWKQFEDPVLDDLINRTLAGNQDLKVAIARVDEFQANLTVARSKYFPQISLGAAASRQKISTSITALPPGIQQVFNIFGLIMNASYLVDLWGQVRSGVEAAYHQWLSAVEARRTVILGLVTSVASTYIQLRELDHQLSVTMNLLKTREETLRLQKMRFERGEVSQLQVDEAISAREMTQVQTQSLQIQIAETENLLSFLLGVPSQEIKRGNPLDETPMPPAVPNFLPSDLLNQRPDIRGIEEQLISANANIGVARAAFFPQVQLGGAVGTESVQFNQLFSNASNIWQYGANIVQQVFTGFALTGQLDASFAQKEEMLHSYLSTILKAIKEANDALFSHKTNLDQVEAEKKRVSALKDLLSLSNLRFQKGEIDYLSYLNAEREFLSSLLSYEIAKGNSFLSYIQIYQAFGGGWVQAADDQVMENNKKD